MVEGVVPSTEAYFAGAVASLGGACRAKGFTRSSAASGSGALFGRGWV